MRTVISYSVPSLEDVAELGEDGDTIRWLMLNDRGLLTRHLWSQAYEDGALGVMAREDDRCFVLLIAQVEDALEGDPSWLEFDHLPSYVEAVQQAESKPKAVRRGFVDLHVHSEYSALDGLSTIKELAIKAAAEGCSALAITDHGTCAGHPALQRACDDVGITPIPGMEAYFIDDRLARPAPGDAEAVRLLRDYNHLILLATDDRGLKNLWSLSTEGFRDGFYHKPRIDWDSLARHSEGLVATSACLGGVISQLLLNGQEDQARARLSRFLDIFGENFYVEIQPSTQEDQHRLNPLLIELAHDLRIPIIAASDGHYVNDGDKPVHKIWMDCQTSKDNEAYWHFDHSLSESEMRQRLSYLDPSDVDEAIENTAKIAERCSARIESKIVMPIFYRKGGYDRDALKLREMCLENWGRIKSTLHSDEVYRERFEREYRMLVDKKYCGYFLMVADYVGWAKDNGILVGPGRGSGAGSLIAFLMRITEVDPVHYDILFERFITEGRKTLPDFDVDFPASKRPEIQGYIREKYGDDHVLRVGTHLRYKSKGIIGKLFSTLAADLPPEAPVDAKKVSAIITEAEAGTAGLGLSWEELWAQEGEQLEPYRQKYPVIFALAERLVNRLNSYGQHPAGMVISTEGSLLDQLPLRRGDGDGLMISQFEFDDLDTMGLIKFDILTIRTLDTLQMTVDGARDHFGIDVNVYDFDLEYADPMVWEEIGEGHTLGMFQIETTSGTKLMRRMKPRSVEDLADAGALVRPGPMRSGLTESYLRRRAGEENVSFPDPRMEQFLAPTQGVMIYQEQVMQACMELAGYDSTEADGVRKILGKKKVDQVTDAGYKFVDGCVAGGMEKNSAQILWDQMAEFARYGFGKAHSVSYAMITFWTAWWKVHYVVPTMVALLSTVDDDRVPDFVREARRVGVEVLPPDVNVSGKGFRPDGIAIRYGLAKIKGIGAKAVADIMIGQPYSSFEEYLANKGKAANSGVTLLLAKIGAFDAIEPNRRALVRRLEAEKDGSSSQCVFKCSAAEPGFVPLEGIRGLNGMVCTFDWATEPRPVNKRTNKLLKAKPLPKQCSKGCRQYKAPEPTAVESVRPYTDREVRTIEQEMLGIQLSSTAFDMLEDKDRALLRQSANLIDKGMPGVHLAAGVINRMRKHRDRSDRDMAFFNLGTEVVDIDVACFADAYEVYKPCMKVGNFVVCQLKRDGRGSQLVTMTVLDT